MGDRAGLASSRALTPCCTLILHPLQAAKRAEEAAAEKAAQEEAAAAEKAAQEEAAAVERAAQEEVAALAAMEAEAAEAEAKEELDAAELAMKAELEAAEAEMEAARVEQEAAEIEREAAEAAVKASELEASGQGAGGPQHLPSLAGAEAAGDMQKEEAGGNTPEDHADSDNEPLSPLPIFGRRSPSPSRLGVDLGVQPQSPIGSIQEKGGTVPEGEGAMKDGAAVKGMPEGAVAAEQPAVERTQKRGPPPLPSGPPLLLAEASPRLLPAGQEPVNA